MLYIETTGWGQYPRFMVFFSHKAYFRLHERTGLPTKARHPSSSVWTSASTSLRLLNCTRTTTLPTPGKLSLKPLHICNLLLPGDKDNGNRVPELNFSEFMQEPNGKFFLLVQASALHILTPTGRRPFRDPHENNWVIVRCNC